MIRKKLSTFVLLIVLMNGVVAFGLPGADHEGNGTATAAPSINYDNFDYYVEELQVFMSVDTSGNIDVFEYINFTFNRGTYSMAYREIPHYGFDTLTGAMVENETAAVLKVGAKYEFDKFKGDYLIRWAFSPEKAPGNESFFISYTVTNAVESVTKDQLGIDWYVIGKDWTVPIKKMSIMLMLPWNVSDSPLFDYKPEKANVTVFMDQTLINFTKEHVRPSTPVRIVVYYPKSFDPSRNILTFLRENTFSVAAFLFLILTLIPLIMVIYKSFLSKVPPKILKPNAAIMADPPKLTTLIQGRYTPLAFFAGVVHLARTGFLRIVDEGLSGDGQLWIEARDAEVDELTVQLSHHDAAVLNAMGEAPARRPMTDVYDSTSKESGDQIMSDLKREGHISSVRRTKVNTTYIMAGLMMTLVSTGILLLLVYGNFVIVQQPSTFWAVGLGGLFLGFILGGISLFILGGFFMPRYTVRGCHEKAQQAAYLENICSEMDTASKKDPHEATVLFNKNAAALTATPLAIKGGFPTFLRKVASQAGDVEYHHSWYRYSETGAESRVFGEFGMAYADTLDKVPHILKGRRRRPKKGKGRGPGGPPMGEYPDMGPMDGMEPVEELTFEPLPAGKGPQQGPKGPGPSARPKAKGHQARSAGRPRAKGKRPSGPRPRSPAGPGMKEGD